MISHRQLFLNHLAQTSPLPIALEIERAEGVYFYDTAGKKYMDLISGISVSNIGHNHPKVIEAIKIQVDQYMHVMVYGEYIQAPQTKLAKLLSDNLPKNLNCTYFVNSGAEAVEGALKLAKRFTGKTEIIAFKNAYHGSTHGSLSVMGDERLKIPFRPLLPDIRFIEFNDDDGLKYITGKTACVIVETIQGEAGVVVPENNFLKKLRKKCNDTNSLLILDEIQSGFGRTGKLFAFEHYDIIPDILCLAKAMGGGMPLGAFVSSKKIMSSLSDNPALGHITTFGGHPVCCAASHAALKVLLEEKVVDYVGRKGKLFKQLLIHPKIKQIRNKGLLLAVEFGNSNLNKKIISKCIQNGVIVDWFLFSDTSLRIAPPLTISEKEIKTACQIILKSIDM